MREMDVPGLSRRHVASHLQVLLINYFGQPVKVLKHLLVLDIFPYIVFELLIDKLNVAKRIRIKEFFPVRSLRLKMLLLKKQVGENVFILSS